ncbi:hypothetical protein G7043_39340 [Lentzea sp. NEAU-D13]|uniref:Uncharacterized protein n=1 Tax=Lentzea alba TaxID=2714351 RepID=A0A7C9RX11_9PSEU|nr:hypothetical protein [Lentzea alba]NGY64987.1 hypothetical protein [Lentzea alba]
MPIEQQPGSAEPETQVFAKIMIEEPTMPATTPVTPTPATPPAATPPPARKPKSLTRRLARRILGPTLMTKK